MTNAKPTTIDEYIGTFPKETQKILQQVRATIKKVIPEADEVISYAIPAFKLNKAYVIYFAGYRNHISLYPVPKGNESFIKEVSPYRTGKGTLQFPLAKPMPLDLITKIVKVSIKANSEREKAKKK